MSGNTLRTVPLTKRKESRRHRACISRAGNGLGMEGELRVCCNITLKQVQSFWHQDTLERQTKNIMMLNAGLVNDLQTSYNIYTFII